MSRLIQAILAVTVVIAVGVAQARADGVVSINLSTGLDASGGVIASGGVNDANWTYSDTNTLWLGSGKA